MKWCVSLVCSLVLLGASTASAQSWNGPLAGGSSVAGFRQGTGLRSCDSIRIWMARSPTS